MKKLFSTLLIVFFSLSVFADNPVPISSGGTSATTATQALTNLGIPTGALPFYTTSAVISNPRPFGVTIRIGSPGGTLRLPPAIDGTNSPRFGQPFTVFVSAPSDDIEIQDSAGNPLETVSQNTVTTFFQEDDGTAHGAWAMMPTQFYISPYALDSAVVHNTGDETVGGIKTFTNPIAGTITGNIAQSQVTNLTTDLAAKANDSDVVKLAGTQTLTGIKKNTGQPAFYAYLNASVTNATGDGTIYTIPFNAESFDQDGNFNTGTNLLTAPTTGLYMGVITITLTNLSSLHNVGYARVNVAGTSAASYPVFIVNPTNVRDANGNMQLVAPVFFTMTAGDTATVSITVSGSTKTVTVKGNAALNGEQTSFAAYLVG